jgi:hypothetical protein
MSSVRVRGSVYQWSSGRWAAVSTPVFDVRVGERRRLSLGTFESRVGALDALTGFNADRSVDLVDTWQIGLHTVVFDHSKWSPWFARGNREASKPDLQYGHLGPVEPVVRPTCPEL